MVFLGSNENLFGVELTYHVPLAEVEPHHGARRTYLETHYAVGTFLATGAKVLRDGGIFIAKSTRKSDVEAIIADDLFHQHQLAHYKVTEFTPSKTATV